MPFFFPDFISLNMLPMLHVHAIPWHASKVTVQSARLKMQPDQKLVKKAVKLALNDLKDKNAGVFLSAHALKVIYCSHLLSAIQFTVLIWQSDTSFDLGCMSLATSCYWRLSFQVRNCAPDLAKTISSLILCSNDSNFRDECFSFLGLPSQGVGSELVEECIKGKIISVIEMNDREQPHRSKEDPSYLFEDGRFQDAGYQDEEYECEDAFTAMDI